jgi:hypothetical protein
LRQGVLESLGWKFHRIWSTDWFRDSKKELDRVILAIERSRQEIANPESSSTPVVTQFEKVEFERSASADEEISDSAVYQKVVLEKWTSSEAIHDVNKAKLAELIRRVVDVEAPVHHADITRRVMDSFGVSRAGSRIVDAVRSALQYGNAIGAFKYEEGFAYSMTSAAVVVRNRADFENSEKKIEHIAPVEIEIALIHCVMHAFTIDRAEANSNALSQLGFSRSTAAISGYMNAIVDSLIDRGDLKFVDEKLTIPSLLV